MSLRLQSLHLASKPWHIVTDRELGTLCWLIYSCRRSLQKISLCGFSVRSEFDAANLLLTLFHTKTLTNVSIDTCRIRSEICDYELLRTRQHRVTLPAQLQFLSITNSDRFYTLFVQKGALTHENHLNTQKNTHKSSHNVNPLYPDGLIITVC